MIITIYGIKDKRLERIIYIGQTNNYENRIIAHKENSLNINKSSLKVNIHMNNEGIDNFYFVKLAICNNDIANQIEDTIINFYNTLIKDNKSWNFRLNVKENFNKNIVKTNRQLDLLLLQDVIEAVGDDIKIDKNELLRKMYVNDIDKMKKNQFEITSCLKKIGFKTKSVWEIGKKIRMWVR